MQTNNLFKRYIGIISVILPMIFATSCDEDYKPETIESGIKIISNNLLFGPLGGVGAIEFESVEAVSAYSEQPWCEVEVEGNRVNVKVQVHDDLENRYSSIILETDNSSARVVAQQNGVIMGAEVEDKYLFSDESSEFKFSYTSNGTVTVASSDSWIRCVKGENEITVNVTENTTGHLRSGSFTYSCGKASKTVIVSQASVKDIYGNYKLNGYSQKGQLVYLPAKISAGENENEVIITCVTEGVSWSFGAKFNPESHTLTFANGQYAGNLNVLDVDFYIYLCILSKASGGFSWNTDFTSSATISYDKEKNSTRLDILPYVNKEDSGLTSYDSWVFAGFMNRNDQTGGPKGNPSIYPAILYTPYFQTY